MFDDNFNDVFDTIDQHTDTFPCYYWITPIVYRGQFAFAARKIWFSKNYVAVNH